MRGEVDGNESEVNTPVPTLVDEHTTTQRTLNGHSTDLNEVLRLREEAVHDL